MCGCGIKAPCFGGCSCGCSHHAPAHVRYLRDSRGYVGGPDPETHNANARPVAVIDPRDPQQVDRLFNMAFERGGGPTALRDALREFANPTPPRPDEPTGLGAVVEDAEGRRWLRFDANTGGWPWIHDGPLDSREYDAITAVRVLSDGVQP